MEQQWYYIHLQKLDTIHGLHIQRNSLMIFHQYNHHNQTSQYSRNQNSLQKSIISEPNQLVTKASRIELTKLVDNISQNPSHYKICLYIGLGSKSVKLVGCTESLTKLLDVQLLLTKPTCSYPQLNQNLGTNTVELCFENHLLLHSSNNLHLLDFYIGYLE